MSDFYRFGKELRELLNGLLAIPTEEQAERELRVSEKEAVRTFEDNLFYGEVNRFVGSGGEILVKGEQNKDAPPTRIDVGDRLIGIGVTHLVESLSRTPGPDAFRAMSIESSSDRKMALRAFEVATKEQVQDGFNLTLAPLSPRDYSELVERVSGGLVKIPVESIPEGTMVLSFLGAFPNYTLRTVPGSPDTNWAEITKGTRHWNVGIGSTTDFWTASFPSDDLSMLSLIPSSTKVGTISFGLSLLPGSKGITNLKRVPCVGRSGTTTTHHFYLSGTAVGTQGLDTPFPIGLRTEIVFHPEK